VSLNNSTLVMLHIPCCMDMDNLTWTHLHTPKFNSTQKRKVSVQHRTYVKENS